MKPYGSDVVNVHAQVAGYRGAVSRFELAAKGQDPVPAYHALFEALNWAASVDFRVSEVWIPHGIDSPPGRDWPATVSGADIVPAFRWVRNTLHHDWADALDLDVSGLSFPITFPMVFFEWRWREPQDLPSNRRTQGKSEYIALLAGQPARLTLQRLDEVFGFVTRLLEPQEPVVTDARPPGRRRDSTHDRD